MSKLWLNNVQVVGNLGHDAELRYTNTQKAVCTFDIAVTKPGSQQYNQPEKTTWFKCVVWGKLAEVLAPRLKKGTQVYFSGELNENKWKDRQGNERKTMELVNYSGFHQLIIIQDGQPRERPAPGPHQDHQTPPPPADPQDDPDLPF